MTQTKMEINKVYLGDSLENIKTFPDESIDCVVTSPPYFALRDYGMDGQIGLEDTPEAYIERLVLVFREIRRCLKPGGTCWVNLGDSYATQRIGQSAGINAQTKGLKHKDLIGIPWMFAFAMRTDGWYLRQDIIWHKPNPMPESVTDRCTKSHEYVFLFSKREKYFFDYEAIQEEATGYDGRKDMVMHGGVKYADQKIMPGAKPQTMAVRGHERWRFKQTAESDDTVIPIRNKRDVWSVNLKPNKEAHFAAYPEELITPCILSGCPEDGVVLDPFMGSGTTGIVARKLGRNFIGCELNPEYQKMAERRIFNEGENLFNQ